jgi:MoxR-like ATPase
MDFSTPSNIDQQKLDDLQNASDALQAEISSVVIGQEDTIDMLFVGLLTGGHILLEGVPGVAKTLLAKSLAQCIDADFGRIQFTPDLMPADITGSQVFNQQSGEFVFRPGPIFTNILLGDEINRAPAKTQAALLEAMEERQITNDGTSYPMTAPFMVLATQNPVEQEGTYRLPEAQLDRFMCKLYLDHPDKTQEVAILTRFQFEPIASKPAQLKRVFTRSQITEFQKTVAQVYIKEELLAYIAEITTQTRQNNQVMLGASPRGSMAIMRASKALAAMRGRGFVIPEDIQHVSPPILRHRIILTPEAEIDGIMPDMVIKRIIETAEVPR